MDTIVINTTTMETAELSRDAIDSLGVEIHALAGHISAATARLTLVADFDKQRDWTGPGLTPALTGCPGNADSVCTPAANTFVSPWCSSINNLERVGLYSVDRTFHRPRHTFRQQK